MPNWCYNTVTVTHKDPAMLDRFVKATEADKLLNEFAPMPEELQNTTSPSPPNEVLEEKYGYSDWYSWALDNWGTKWDITNSAINHREGNEVQVYFDTAWSPPIAFYEALKMQGFTVDALYTEEGMGFAGHYSDGEDNCADLSFDENSQEWIDSIEDKDLKWIVQEEYDRWLDYQQEDETEGD